MISRSRKEPSCHDPERKKWFLGQGSRQASMTRRKEMISRSRKQASQHDSERENDFRVMERSKPS